ncbi:MAG: right-handed parallel beta-helix repeat-containing protein [Candidatus Aenigmarchaeota archaeon]|nr:right-handed parallel beta-helix repeat-containing protein [Candidatus Aenigmarchaeota archaeon]
MSQILSNLFKTFLLFTGILFLSSPIFAINLTSCSTLGDTNTEYNLTGDIIDMSSEICLKVTATRITINCQGHTISGNGTTGIYSNKYNTIIKNCILEGWDKGIHYEGSNNGKIENTTISSCGETGIHFSVSSDNIFKNNILDNNYCGIKMGYSSNNRIYNNLFNNTNNIEFYGTGSNNFWNTTKQKGARIYSDGNYIGGNYWATSGKTGYSEICTDSNTDGFCDEEYAITEDENNVDYIPLSNKYAPDLIPPELEIISPSDNQIFHTFNLEITINVQDPTLHYTNISIGKNSLIENYTITSDSGIVTVNLSVSVGGYYNITAIAYDLSDNSNSTTVFQILTPIKVTECSNLDISGGKYYLTKDITNTETASCINIQIDNVTFDCMGHTIYSSGGVYTTGVYLNNIDNTNIKNCLINGWDYGLLLESSSKSTITNSTFFNNVLGMFFSASSDNNIYNNRFKNINNIEFYGTILFNSWNTTKQEGIRIYSTGSCIGGNYWANLTGQGYSDYCKDSDMDGFCDEEYAITEDENNVDYLPLSNKYVPDLEAPNTTIIGIEDTGDSYNFEDWTNADYVEINLSCSDLRLGCNKTFYCIDLNNTCTPDLIYSESIFVDSEGTSYIRYYSVDNAENEELLITKTINLLSSDYKVLINYPLSNSYLNNYNITASISVLDNKTLDYVVIILSNSTDIIENITTTKNGTFTVNLSVYEDGIYSISATFYDKNGFKNEHVSENLVMDTVPPVITSFEIIEEYDFGSSFIPLCMANDNLKGSFNGFVAGWNPLTSGEQTTTCTATDDAGNYAIESRNYTIIALICEDNQKRCMGKQSQECISNAWITSETCDYSCSPITFNCVPKPPDCEGEEKRCSGNDLQICANNSWKTSKICDLGCNNTLLDCNSSKNPVDMSLIIMLVVALVFVIGGAALVMYFKSTREPDTDDLTKKFEGIKNKIKELKIQGINTARSEKEMGLAKQDANMGLSEMAKTRLEAIGKRLEKAKQNVGKPAPQDKPPEPPSK